MTSTKFFEILKRVPSKVRNYNRMSMSIAAYLDDVIKSRFNNQREFADLMEKNESEVSKWLSGKHNFTIKSIANIEAKLNVQILYTPIDIAEMEKAPPDKEEVVWNAEYIYSGYKGTVNLKSNSRGNLDYFPNDLGENNETESNKLSFPYSNGHLRLVTDLVPADKPNDGKAA
jgi:transcriptional regulator with XRE-family HTH domain